MADIKTMTQEITDLSIDIKETMTSGEYAEVVKVLEKIVEKLDEIVEKFQLVLLCNCTLETLSLTLTSTTYI